MTNYDVAPIAGFDPQIGLLLAALDDSTREWRENLGEPTLEAIGWQARIEGPSIGTLILHMADCEAYWFETFATGKQRPRGELKRLLAKEIDQDSGVWPSAPEMPIAEYFALHDAIRARAVEALRDIAPDRVYQGRRNTFTLRWIVAHVVEHDSYHGGQAVLLHETWKNFQKPAKN